jgi:hypothetical protein
MPHSAIALESCRPQHESCFRQLKHHRLCLHALAPVLRIDGHALAAETTQAACQGLSKPPSPGTCNNGPGLGATRHYTQRCDLVRTWTRCSLHCWQHQKAEGMQRVRFRLSKAASIQEITTVGARRELTRTGGASAISAHATPGLPRIQRLSSQARAPWTTNGSTCTKNISKEGTGLPQMCANRQPVAGRRPAPAQRP